MVTGPGDDFEVFARAVSIEDAEKRGLLQAADLLDEWAAHEIPVNDRFSDLDWCAAGSLRAAARAIREGRLAPPWKCKHGGGRICDKCEKELPWP